MMKVKARKALIVVFGFLVSQSANSDVHFPTGFQWCVSTAAHQIEGYNINSDWWDWEQIPGHIANGDKSGAACDSWNRVSEDVAMLEHLGVTTYRFSVEWAKIEPEEGHFDQSAIDHYRDEVDQLRAAGISPMITLQHLVISQASSTPKSRLDLATGLRSTNPWSPSWADILRAKLLPEKLEKSVTSFQF
jgi:hypothetical protein